MAPDLARELVEQAPAVCEPTGMPPGPRNYVLFVEKPDGVGDPCRLECEDLDAAERQGRSLMTQGHRVSIEVRENQTLLYTLHL